MKRRLYLEIVGTTPPTGAYQINPGVWAVDLDLKRTFHNGYIEVHLHPPRRGTNPLFDEYTNLLATGNELRFKPPGIANDDDLRSGESHKLGRIFARAYLSEHHMYRWFAHFSNLEQTTMRGWSVSSLKAGDFTPDWLVTKPGSAALAEAKGTHGNITNISSILTDWRTQATNARVQKNHRTYKLKSWIVATRWVTSDQPKTHPKIYVEDPILEAENELNESELPTVELNSATLHVSQCLYRIQQRRLAARLESGIPQKQPPKIRVPLWRCVLPRLAHLRFVGVPRLEISGPTLSWLLLNEFFFWPLRHFPEPFFHRDAIRFIGSDAFFDGIDFRSVDALLQNRVPESFEEFADEYTFPEDVSFLSDGSLIAPMDLMEPLEIIDVQ